MKIGYFNVWLTAKQAAAEGATHHGRIHGIMPGYVRRSDPIMWLPKSDLLIPIEYALAWFIHTVDWLAGREPLFTFDIGAPIDTADNER